MHECTYAVLYYSRVKQCTIHIELHARCKYAKTTVYGSVQSYVSRLFKLRQKNTVQFCIRRKRTSMKCRTRRRLVECALFAWRRKKYLWRTFHLESENIFCWFRSSSGDEALTLLHGCCHQTTGYSCSNIYGGAFVSVSYGKVRNTT